MFRLLNLWKVILKGISIHIGVNNLDFVKDYYGRGLQPLKSCFHDAEVMSSLLGTGFEEILILKDCTKDEVIQALEDARDKLTKRGDFLVLTFSGHGIRVPDQNGDERQNGRMDSSWCLKDGVLLDDTITSLLFSFVDGVRIVVISDSCQSGTIVDFKRVGYTQDFIELAKKEQGVDFQNLESKILRAKGFEFAIFDEKKLNNDLAFLKRPEIEKLCKQNLQIINQRMEISKFNELLNDISTNGEVNISSNQINELVKKHKIMNTPFSEKNRMFLKLDDFSNDDEMEDIFSDLSKIPLIENAQTLPADLVSLIHKDKLETFKKERDSAKSEVLSLVRQKSKSVKEFADLREIILISACKDDETTKGGCCETDNSYFVSAIREICQNMPNGEGYQYLHQKLCEKLKNYKVAVCNAAGEFTDHWQTPQISHSPNICYEFLQRTKPFTIQSSFEENCI